MAPAGEATLPNSGQPCSRRRLPFLHTLEIVPSSSRTTARRRQVYRIVRTHAGGNVGLALLGAAAFVALWTLLIADQPVGPQSSGVAAWWTMLCAVAVINVCAWHRAALLVARQAGRAEASLWRFQRWQLLLSAVFVFGC